MPAAVLVGAWAATSLPGSLPSPRLVVLLHRQEGMQKISFHLDRFSEEAWLESGDDYFCAQGHLHFRQDAVSEEIWVLERPELDRIRLPLALAGAPRVELPSDDRLLLHWESGVEVLQLESAAYVAGLPRPESRLSRLHDFEDQGPNGDPADAALERIRATVTVHDDSLRRSQQALDRAGPGFLEIGVATGLAVFSAEGELRAGAGTGTAALCVGLDDAGDFWLWYE